MYFIDRNNITATLTYMNSIVNVIDKTSKFPLGEVEELALERIAQNIIESIIDVGNSMIDGFIMRDPGSYDDIIDILLDEKVITADMESSLKEVLSLRKMLVREFMNVDHQLVAQILIKNINTLNEFPKKIDLYLTNELGPVSAFIPENS
ncbi:DUF86 domain-containing protein [Paenisporosarcina quisquiliarum]|uniref:DUF86 domain-containing protein n=1 Tax=Paenisporosarcina quisquiliarum TaxID=365346 RepID=UPI00373704E5